MKHKDKIISLIAEIVDLLKDDEIQQTENNNLPVVVDKTMFPTSMHELLDLLQSDEWPEAAPGFLICEDNEEDKFDRAEGILDYISEDLSNKKFLDFGCGEGHVVIKASEVCSKAIGYDIAKSGVHTWETHNKYLLTQNYDKLVKYAPYDIILLYDVLDHCNDPIDLMKLVKGMCSAETKVFVRCHPWMSRTGGHLYKKLNKAWIHLVFTEEELAKMNCRIENVRKYNYPLKTQSVWFNASGFETVQLDTISTIVEPFFQKPQIAERINVEFDGTFPEPQMKQNFNDYILKIKT